MFFIYPHKRGANLSYANFTFITNYSLSPSGSYPAAISLSRITFVFDE